MYSKVGDIISAFGAFPDGVSYLRYIDDHVIPCVVALATSVTKDVLWKPLNHKLLMMTREKNRHMRIAAIKTIHQLFQEVGEEYLLLLPECLPFISELVEDDDETVLNLTAEMVKFIENISGESLDQYFQ